MPEPLSLLRNLGQVARELSTGFDAHFKELNLTSARARVLMLLRPAPDGVSQAGVTEHLRVEHPTAVRILDGLESRGYIHRLPAPEDRRAKVIVLTEEGRLVAEKVAEIMHKLNASLMSQLDPDDAATANRVLLELLTHIQTMKAAARSDSAQEDASA